MKDAFAQDPAPVFPSISVTQNNWNASPSVSGAAYSIVLTQKAIFVKFNIDRPDANENKRIFDSMFAGREQIEASFGGQLNWRRMEKDRASRIEAALECDGFNEENWPEMIAWAAKASTDLEAALSEPFRNALSELARTAG